MRNNQVNDEKFKVGHTHKYNPTSHNVTIFTFSITYFIFAHTLNVNSFFSISFFREITHIHI